MANTRPAIKCDFGFAMARHKQHHRDSPPGGSQRQLRVGELVRHALAEMLTRGDVHDPVIERHNFYPLRTVGDGSQFSQIPNAAGHEL